MEEPILERNATIRLMPHPPSIARGATAWRGTRGIANATFQEQEWVRNARVHQLGWRTRFGEDVMATEKTDEVRRQKDEVPSGVGTQRSGGADSGPPPSDMMSGLWVSWMNRYFGAARDWIDSDKPWWQV